MKIYGKCEGKETFREEYKGLVWLGQVWLD